MTLLTREAIRDFVDKMQEYDRSPEGIQARKNAQKHYEETFFSEKELKYEAREDKHIVFVPPALHENFYDGEDVKSEIKNWLKENVPAHNIHAWDALCDVHFIFETKEDAMAFKLRWC